METALVIVLDEAEPFDEVRREYASRTVARGIPFHISLLYPFAPREVLNDALLARVASFFTQRAAFEFTLARIARWPTVVYAEPEPDAAFRVIMDSLHAMFPQWPPYGGAFADVVPHATLGEEIDAAAVHGEIERRLTPHLPLRCQARDVALLEEFSPERWRERGRFVLGG